MGKRWALLLAAVAVTVGGCPSDGDDDAAGEVEGFCDAYLEAAELGIDTDEGVARMREAAELAPGRIGDLLALMIELGEATSAIPEDQDVTGDMASMEIIARMQTPEYEAAGRELEQVVTGDCGVERTPVSLTPMTGIRPLED